jgi:HlyD family secretion protein
MGASRRQAVLPSVEIAVPVEVRPVESSTLVLSVSAGGSVAATEEVTITTKVIGRVESVLVREGDRVRAGQVVLRLESGELMAQLRQAQASLVAAQARLQMMQQGARPQERSQVEEQVKQAEANLVGTRARLQMLERGARPQERSQAEAAVAQARSNYETARANLERTQALFQAGAVSKAQLDAAQLQTDVARSQYDAAQQQLSLVQAGARPEEIEMARSQVRAAQAQLNTALQQRGLVLEGPRAQEIQMAQAQVAQAQAGVAFARLQLANATVVSPLTGTVTRRFVDPGTLVALMPGQGALLTVAQIDTVDVILDVSETDLARIRPGQSVTVRADAYAEQTFAGTVREIGQAADPRVRVFKVKVKTPNPKHLLKPGMFARGQIIAETRQNALVIPRDAVVSDSSQPAVFVVKEGKAQVRKVRLGLTSGAAVEVLEGLAKGDPVVVAGQSGLTDGASVVVR